MVGDKGEKDMTVPEVAERLGVSQKDVYGYIASGELPAWNKAVDPLTTRPRYRVPVHAVDAFKQRRMVTPKVVAPLRVRRWRRGLDVL